MRKKIIVLAIIGLFVTPIFSPPASAAFSGCPNTWAAPSDQQIQFGSLPKDLASVKKERPFDVVITQLSDEYSIDSSNWLKVGTNSSILEPLTYAFSGKTGRQVWKIEVQGCAESATRYYPYNLAKIRDAVENRDVKTFFNDASNREKFDGPKNFQEYTALNQAFEKCKNEVISNGKIYYSEIGSQEIWRSGYFSRSGACGQLQNINERIELFFKDGSCARIDGTVYRIANGVTCKAFLGLYYYPAFSLSLVNFISFEEFEITGPVDQTVSIKNRAAASARFNQGTPYMILTGKYTNLLSTMVNSLWSTVRLNKELTPKFNALKSRILESRAEIERTIYQEVPDSEVVVKLPQWEKQFEETLREVNEIEQAAIQAKSLICAKGKTTKTVVGKNPKCPPGYKPKK